jgi:hypothetical protein
VIGERTPSEGGLTPAWVQLDDEPFAAPKLYGATVHKRLGVLDGGHVIGANHGLAINNVTIIADRIRSIFSQVIHPWFRAGRSIAVVINGRAAL